MEPSPAASAPGVELQSTFGTIDIYLFDQLLRGHFDRRRRVLDAGCGDGRNLTEPRLRVLRHRPRSVGDRRRPPPRGTPRPAPAARSRSTKEGE
jgi:hypothetical protein